LSIAFIGDLHGEFNTLKKQVNRVKADHYIQVGDFGVWPQIDYYGKIVDPGKPVYWIRGNHEWEPDIVNLTEVTELRPNMFFVPDGSILELDGIKLGFLGGAESIDKAWRREGVSWFASESLKLASVHKLYDNMAKMGRIDILVTHTPPSWVCKAMLPSGSEMHPSSKLVEAAWDHCGRPPLICGHMHESKTFGQVHVLDIAEVMLFDGDMAKLSQYGKGLYRDV
jgi:Icc-related predicted phosphoesterase